MAGKLFFKNFKKHVDIISNTDIMEISNKKSNSEVKTMKNLHGATNFREYYEFVYNNTPLTLEESFKICLDYWNKGVHKYEVVKIINSEV